MNKFERFRIQISNRRTHNRGRKISTRIDFEYLVCSYENYSSLVEICNNTIHYIRFINSQRAKLRAVERREKEANTMLSLHFSRKKGH